MITDKERFQRAIARFDEANAADSNREVADGGSHPKELLYAERMSAMLDRVDPQATEALRLAARCQHLQRWKIPRSEYPMTPAGYQQWRTRLMKFHAETAGAVLREAGYAEPIIGRVQSLLKKESLKRDPETQTLEDVVGLVFLESYLADFAASHGQFDEAKLSDILRKTSRKMSARGRRLALTLIQPAPQFLAAIRAAMGAAD